jgi:hypothetical protein
MAGVLVSPMCDCVCVCADALLREFLHGFAIKVVLFTTRCSRGTRGLQNGVNFTRTHTQDQRAVKGREIERLSCELEASKKQAALATELQKELADVKDKFRNAVAQVHVFKMALRQQRHTAHIRGSAPGSASASRTRVQCWDIQPLCPGRGCKAGPRIGTARQTLACCWCASPKVWRALCVGLNMCARHKAGIQKWNNVWRF